MEEPECAPPALSAWAALMDAFPPDDEEQKVTWQIMSRCCHPIYCLMDRIAAIISGFIVNMLPFFSNT